MYRHELKLSINALDRAVLSSRLSKVLPRDPHSGPGGTYTVRSIYFDDDRDTALLQKLTGQLYREKFRLRTYGRDSGVIYLERKIKRGNLGCKEKARLSRDQCLRLLAGDHRFLLDRPEAVCRALYAKMATGLFRPRTIVEYDREAYVWEPGRVRITIDSNLRTGLRSADFLNFDLKLAPVVGRAVSVLEIKYRGFIPIHILNLVQLESRGVDSISKYVLGRRFG
ncbi:MAG TPA: polyphosphate polymerase domain-containing protein [Limnochordales bacterium]